ncbi:MAG TPA: response regulator [Vicinamibacteria bacterium]|nr:response regulator [Vicinamibacteria bacterium]
MSTAAKKVLVVDDAGPVIILCVNVLQSLGYLVKGANRGEAALDMIRSEHFDLMLLDYKMPGMNGFQVFSQARTLRPDMAFLLATAHATPEIIQEARHMGFSSILLKPFSSAELRAAVEKALAEKV